MARSSVRPVRLSWIFELAAPPAVAWGWVADTNRMNRLAGLGPVRYEAAPGPDGRLRRQGLATLAGMAARWDEPPFDWTFPERFAITRTFHGGAIAAYTSTVTLAPLDGGRTRLTHVVELTPRASVLGPLVAYFTRDQEAGWAAAYAAVDAHLRGAAPDPFAKLSGEGAAQPAFAAPTAALRAAGHADADIARLVGLVAAGDDLEVQHLRPFALADRWQAERTAVLDLCLGAVGAGLLEPRWSHLCPRCRGPKGSVARLADLQGQAACDDCGVAFTGAFDRSVELAFRPHPALRTVQEAVYCVAGPGATPHVVFQAELAPGEQRALALDLAPGAYRLRGPWGDGALDLVYGGEGGADQAPTVLALGLGAPAAALTLTGPRLALGLTNDTAGPLPVFVEREAWSDDAVTAAYASTVPAFRALLERASVGTGLALPVGLLAFVALRAHGTTAVYRELGPAAGFAVVTGWLDGLAVAIAAARGTVYKRAGDTLLAAFYDPLAAVEAGLALLELLQDAPVPHSALALSIGADAGPCMATGPGVDYAGGPVQQALEAAAAAGPGELVLSGALAAEPGVAFALTGSLAWEVLEPAAADELVRVVPAWSALDAAPVGE